MTTVGFQTDTRNAIPGYDGLLFVYSILLVPVLFSLLVGLNILVWSRARINYVFIFGKCLLVYTPIQGFHLFHRAGLEDETRS